MSSSDRGETVLVDEAIPDKRISFVLRAAHGLLQALPALISAIIFAKATKRFGWGATILAFCVLLILAIGVALLVRKRHSGAHGVDKRGAAKKDTGWRVSQADMRDDRPEQMP